MQFIGGSISQGGQISTITTRLNVNDINISSLVAKDIAIDQVLSTLSSGKVDVSVFSTFNDTITSRVSGNEATLQQIQADLPNFINESIVSEIQEQAGVVIQQQLLNESSPLYAKLLEKVDVIVQDTRDNLQDLTVSTLSTTVQSLNDASALQIQTLSTTNVSQLQSLSASTNLQIQTLSTTNVSQLQSLSATTNLQIQTLSTTNVSQLQSLSATTTSQIQTLSTTNVAQLQTLSTNVVTQVARLDNTDYDWEKRFLSVEEYIRAMQQTYSLSYTDPNNSNNLVQFQYSGTYKGLPVPPPPFTIQSISDSLQSFNVVLNVTEYGLNVVGSLQILYNNGVTPNTPISKATLLGLTRNSDQSVNTTIFLDKSLAYDHIIRMVDSRNNIIYSLTITPEIIEQYAPISANPNNRVIAKSSTVGSNTGENPWGIDTSLSNTWRNLELVSPDNLTDDGDGDTLSNEQLATGALNPALVSGKAVLIQRGGVAFTVKAQNAQNAGAAMVVLYQSNGNDAALFAAGTPSVTIPVVVIDNITGEGLLVRIRNGERLFANVIFNDFENHLFVVQDRRLNSLPSLYPFTELVALPDGLDSNYVRSSRLFRWSFTPVSTSVGMHFRIGSSTYSNTSFSKLYNQASPSENLLSTVVNNSPTIFEFDAVNNIYKPRNRNLPGGESSLYVNNINTPDLLFNNLVVGETYIIEIDSFQYFDNIDFALIILDTSSGINVNVTRLDYNLSTPISISDNVLTYDFNNLVAYNGSNSNQSYFNIWEPYTGRFVLSDISTGSQWSIFPTQTTMTNIRTEFPDIASVALRMEGMSLPAANTPRYLPLLQLLGLSVSDLANNLSPDISGYNFLSGNAVRHRRVFDIQSDSHLSFRWKVQSSDLTNNDSVNRDVALCVIQKVNSLVGEYATQQVISNLIAYPADSINGVSTYSGIFDIELEPGIYQLGFIIMNENDPVASTLAAYQSISNIRFWIDDVSVQPNSVYVPLTNPPIVLGPATNSRTDVSIDPITEFNDGGSPLTEYGFVYSLTNIFPVIGGVNVTQVAGTSLINNTFTASLTGLTEHTTYNVRAYANNINGFIRYSPTVQLMTAGKPVLNTVNIGSIEQSANGYNVRLNTNIVRSGLVMSEYKALYAAVDTLNGNELSILNGTFSTIAFNTSADAVGTSLLMPDLEANKTYKVAAYGTNIYGQTMASQILEFTTPNGIPTITLDSDDALNDGQYTVTFTPLDGAVDVLINDMNIVSTGGSDITAKGIVYSKNAVELLNVDSSSKTVETTNLTTGIFSSLLANLEPTTVYYYRAYASNSSGTAYGLYRNFTTPASFPLVETVSVSDIAFDRAVLTGKVVSNGGNSANTTAGILVSSVASIPIIGNSAQLVFASGMFSNQTYTLETKNFFQSYPLPPNTLHYYRAYATNASGTRYGAIMTFTTPPSAPIISTDTVVNITNNSATTGGTITRDGGSSVTRRGVVYSTVNVDDGPVLNAAATTFVDATVGGTGSFVVSLTGLNLSTTYFIRAYAENALGISYGLVTSFTTLASAPSGAGTFAELIPNSFQIFSSTVNGANYYGAYPYRDPANPASNLVASNNTSIQPPGPGSLKSFRFAFIPTSITTIIRVLGNTGYGGEEAILSIHKQGSSINLLDDQTIYTFQNNSPLIFQPASPFLSGLNGAGFTSINNHSRYLKNGTVSTSTNPPAIGIFTLNNLDIGNTYIITFVSGFVDAFDELSFAILNSSNQNIPIYFTNFTAFIGSPPPADPVSSNLIASNDIGARGGSGGTPVVQTPAAGTVSILPAITTNNIVNVNVFTVSMGATVQNIGSDLDPTSVISGIVYGTSSTGLTKDAVGRTTVVLGTGSGSKTHNAVGLLPNTTYFVRAWVSSGFGISYGAVIPFTTLMAYDVQSVSISNIQATELDFTLNRVSSTGQLGYLYSTNNTNPVLTSSDVTTVLVNGPVGQNTFTLTGLLEDTVYYVRPFINTTANDAVNIGYGQTISMRTRVSNTTNITPDTYTNGTSIDFVSVSNIYYKHSFTTGASDTGVVMQLYLRKLKPTTNNFIMHIVDNNGVSVMGPSNTTVAGNAQSTLINSGNNIVLSSPNTNVTATVTLTGLESSTTYYIVNNVVDPAIGAEIQVGIAGNSNLNTNLEVSYVAASQLLSDIYTQTPYPVTYGLADGVSIDANKLTTSTVNVNGDVRQFRTTPNPSVQNTVTFNLSNEDLVTESLNTVQYTYAHLSSSTPVYVTYGGVEYDLEIADFGTGVFVPGNTTYIYKTVARDVENSPNGIVPGIVNGPGEHQGEGMYLVTIGTLSTNEVALSFTKISAFRLIGSVFGVNGFTTDQYTLVKSQINNYEFTLTNIPFAAGEFKIRSDSVWPQSNSGIFEALDLELDSSSGLSGIRDSNGYESNLVFNGLPSTYNVTLVMSDIHRMKLMLVPSSGIAASRFASSSALLTVGNTYYNNVTLSLSYTGSYTTSGLLISASPNIQLAGSGVTTVFTQSNFNLSQFNYNLDTTELTEYYARYYIVDVNNSIVYSNEVTFITPVKPSLTITNVINNGLGDTVLTYNYVGQSLPFVVKKQVTNESWSTLSEVGDATITPQSGNGLTMVISGFTVAEGMFVRVVDLVNAEFVSAAYHVESAYNNVVSITGVTANANELSVGYDVVSAFTGYNNSLMNPSMYVQYRIGNGSFTDYTLVENKLAAASTGNTVVGYNSALPNGTNISFRFKIVDANGGYILSNIFGYTVPAPGKTIFEVADKSLVSSNIYINPETTILLEGYSVFFTSFRNIYMPYKDLASGNYFIARVYDSDGFAGSSYKTYQDIPDANTLYALSTDFSFANPLNYDVVNNKFYAPQDINEVSTTIEVNVLPLSPPVDVEINSFSYDNITTELSITYNSTQVRNVTVERYRYANDQNNWDVIDTVSLQSGTGLLINVTVPQAVIDLSATVDKIIFRLTDASLSVKALK